MFGPAHSGPCETRVAPEYRATMRAHAESFHRSHAQGMAVRQLVNDCVLSPARVGGYPAAAFDISPFLTLVLERLLLYGYALFRTPPGAPPEVADNRNFYIYRHRGVWRPRRYEGRSTQTHKWHLVVLEPPRVEARHAGPKAAEVWVTVAPSSAGARASLMSLALDELILHRRQRNLFNSQPTMFMSEANDSVDGKSAWRTLYPTAGMGDAMPSSMQPSSSQATFQELLNHRMIAARSLRRFDADVTAEQTASGNAVGSVPTVPGGLEPTRDPAHQAHAELLLSSGYSATPSRHLTGDAQEEAVVRDLIFSIFDAYGVPPGKFGLNRNTERMAGNLIISQQPLQIYNRLCGRIIESLNAILAVALPRSVQLEAALDPAIVSTLAPMLKPEVTARLYARSHGLSVADFDLDQIRAAAGDVAGPDSHRAKPAAERAANHLTKAP